MRQSMFVAYLFSLEKYGLKVDEYVRRSCLQNQARDQLRKYVCKKKIQSGDHLGSHRFISFVESSKSSDNQTVLLEMTGADQLSLRVEALLPV
jgi:hypothetical protein